uniref:Parvalbumin n=1 Tax=Mola mola TaxID=94237 RepID=A0A3Q4AHD6_MOLML
MAFAGILNITVALMACQDFNHKDFFTKVSLAGKSTDDIKKVFSVIDQDRSGFIEEDEIKLLLQTFCPSARALTKAESVVFLQANDCDGDGKIGFAGEANVQLYRKKNFICNLSRIPRFHMNVNLPKT